MRVEIDLNPGYLVQDPYESPLWSAEIAMVGFAAAELIGSLTRSDTHADLKILRSYIGGRLIVASHLNLTYNGAVLGFL